MPPPRLSDLPATSYLPQSLNDDLWHTVTYSRRGNKLHAAVDDEEPRRGEGEEVEEGEEKEKERGRRGRRRRGKGPADKAAKLPPQPRRTERSP